MVLIGICGVALGKVLSTDEILQSPISYEECVKAKDSMVTESYPATCVTKNGQRFVQPLTEENEETTLREQDPKVVIQTVSVRCQAGEKLSGRIIPTKGLVAFSGTITDISPCAKTYASIRHNGLATDVIIRAVQITDVVCTQCLGLIDFQGVLTGLPQDKQNFRLVYERYKDGKKQEIVLDTKTFNFDSDVEGKFCGGIASNLPENQCPAGFRCRLDGSYPDASGKCVKK